MKKSVYDIGDWVFVRYLLTPPSIGVILDIDVDGVEPILYQVLIQNHDQPVWLHQISIEEAID